MKKGTFLMFICTVKIFFVTLQHNLEQRFFKKT